MEITSKFFYVYKTLERKGYTHLNEQNMVKVCNVFYIADLYHRLLFGNPLEKYIKYEVSQYGMNTIKHYYGNPEHDGSYYLLTADKKSLVRVCLKKWFCEMSSEDLTKIIQGESEVLSLTAWSEAVSLHGYGATINDKMIEKDIDILEIASASWCKLQMDEVKEYLKELNSHTVVSTDIIPKV